MPWVADALSMAIFSQTLCCHAGGCCLPSTWVLQAPHCRGRAASIIPTGRNSPEQPVEAPGGGFLVVAVLGQGAREPLGKGRAPGQGGWGEPSGGEAECRAHGEAAKRLPSHQGAQLARGQEELQQVTCTGDFGRLRRGHGTECSSTSQGETLQEDLCRREKPGGNKSKTKQGRARQRTGVIPPPQPSAAATEPCLGEREPPPPERAPKITGEPASAEDRQPFPRAQKDEAAQLLN